MRCVRTWGSLERQNTPRGCSSSTETAALSPRSSSSSSQMWHVSDELVSSYLTLHSTFITHETNDLKPHLHARLTCEMDKRGSQLLSVVLKHWHYFSVVQHNVSSESDKHHHQHFTLSIISVCMWIQIKVFNSKNQFAHILTMWFPVNRDVTQLTVTEQLVLQKNTICITHANLPNLLDLSVCT